MEAGARRWRARTVATRRRRIARTCGAGRAANPGASTAPRTSRARGSPCRGGASGLSSCKPPPPPIPPPPIPIPPPPALPLAARPLPLFSLTLPLLPPQLALSLSLPLTLFRTTPTPTLTLTLTLTLPASVPTKPIASTSISPTSPIPYP